MKITEKRIAETVKFHGHECPGLWLGIKAAELCLRELGENSEDNPLVCVVETDMCGVDAVQFLTGCTFGKGNLIHRDYGKNAFTFFSRKTEEGFRAVIKPDIFKENRDAEKKLAGKVKSGKASGGDRKKLKELKRKRAMEVMETSPEALFDVKPASAPPRPPYILESRECAECGETAMESRVRLLGGKTYCIPCFGKFEQKR